MKKTSHFWLIIVLFLGGGFYACVPETPEKAPNTVEIDLADSTLYDIWEFGAFEQTDSLVVYLFHENPNYRWAALQAFTSYSKEIPIARLSELLGDPVLEVRTLAAYILGQSHNAAVVPLLVEAFDNEDSAGINTHFNAAILEAVGKTGGKEEARLISGISTYLPSDSMLTLVQLRSLYQMALRDIQSAAVTKLMVDRATQSLYAPTVRIVAANYLARFQKDGLDSHQFALIRAFNKESETEVQVQLAALMPFCPASKAKEALESAVRHHMDYRVRVAAAIAMQHYEYSSVAALMQEVLKDPHPKVAAAAAEFFAENGEENDAVNYRLWAQDEKLHWKTRFQMYGAALKNLPFYYQLTKTALNGEIKSLYSITKDPYKRAVILENMAWDPGNVEFLIERYKQDQHPIIETTAIRMLGRILENPQFNLILGNRAYSLRRQIFELLQSVIEKGPNGPLCEAVQVANKFSKLAKSSWAKNTSLIVERYQNLDLPRQLEAALYLEQLMNTLEISFDAVYHQRKMHVADHSQLSRLSDSTLVSVNTDKGEFLIELFPSSAPTTVSNFMHLVDEEFYNGKVWHRIVPNFVAQTGCPDGDGYGSLDYVIPSEFGNRHYSGAGYIGMASAGPDTECTQWFVTYQATPHLDGRHTLFGRISAGMETLDQLEPGDKIKSMKILKAKNDE